MKNISISSSLYTDKFQSLYWQTAVNTLLRRNILLQRRKQMKIEVLRENKYGWIHSEDEEWDLESTKFKQCNMKEVYNKNGYRICSI